MACAGRFRVFLLGERGGKTATARNRQRKRKLTAHETRRGLQLWELRKQHAAVRREIGTGAHTRTQAELLTLLHKAHRLEAEIDALAGELEGETA
ncbi:hypothetical protein [Geminisphaera colitermitum]|uniref:hypothetical protein n=1 Tax=Geminisphaera colitermitum TaxID=1148786 RepID=UPI000158CA70|nr:hypothetical protein [Geminisphaera colitermitum]